MSLHPFEHVKQARRLAADFAHYGIKATSLYQQVRLDGPGRCVRIQLQDDRCWAWRHEGGDRCLSMPARDWNDYDGVMEDALELLDSA